MADSGAHRQELDFQDHVRDYLITRHGYRLLNKSDITRHDLALAGRELWAFLQATDQAAIKELEDDYHGSAQDEIIRALEQELRHRPLWHILRRGLPVRGREVKLFYPKPWSPAAAVGKRHTQNRWAVFPHFHFGERNEEVDLVIYLNGLPIVAVELKHEAAGQTVEDAVCQYAQRASGPAVFSLPFLYLAADTTKVKMATDPKSEENFRWLNADLVNVAEHPETEYPVEHLYRDVLSPEQLSEAISRFLIQAPAGYSIFPRYHQSRMVRRLCANLEEHHSAKGHIGKKYLIHHSAGSGKTLSMCWLAEHVHSLYDQSTGQKLTDTVFIITDRTSLDKNVSDELKNFTHLKDIVGFARKAEDLNRYLKNNTPIIVSTIQKFAWILEALHKNPRLKTRRVAFLIDEAHRSQDNRLGNALRTPFRADQPDEPDDDPATDEEPDDDGIADMVRHHDHNQLFVAFTATPSQNTGVLFGSSFDTYTEAQAIEEGYILDVANKIISWKTLYHIGWRKDRPEGSDQEFPKPIVSRALRTMAYQDMELIQFKSEEMLSVFEQRVAHLIGDRAKAMVVATSRIAGLRYYQTIKKKLEERGVPFQCLYAFSDFQYQEPGQTEIQTITETAINGLSDGEKIEDRFATDQYRIMVVANKFQTGFDQPLLAGMFLDKVVSDRSAVQTVSRLNRSHPGKDTVVVVDFTNNAEGIIKAFQKYRGENPHPPREPDAKECTDLYVEILAAGLITHEEIERFQSIRLPVGNALVQGFFQDFKVRLESTLPDPGERRRAITLMERFVERYQFLSMFFSFTDEVHKTALCLDYCVPQLLLRGGKSEINTLLSHLYLPKASVKFIGEKTNDGTKRRHGGGGAGGAGGSPPKATIDDIIDDLRQVHPISDAEALLIREVTEEKMGDVIIRDEVARNHFDTLYLTGPYRRQIHGDIQDAYQDRGHDLELGDQRYIGPGGIFDYMAVSIIDHHLNGLAI